MTYIDKPNLLSDSRPDIVECRIAIVLLAITAIPRDSSMTRYSAESGY